jgi:hypothetical protein
MMGFVQVLDKAPCPVAGNNLTSHLKDLSKDLFGQLVLRRFQISQTKVKVLPFVQQIVTPKVHRYLSFSVTLKNHTVSVIIEGSRFYL